ncbi:MAG: NUDIX hydrolase [Lachnospiraceae bacterium]|nr:NUDIX hydrolase [Lachnospiraceae bacterium]
MEHRIKRVKRTLLREGSVLNFYRDTMLLRDGSQEEWDFVEHKRGGGACIVPVLPDGRILMVRQYRPSIERETLELPAGAKDSADEEPGLTARRELQEETGYRAGKMTFLCRIKTAAAWCDEETVIFLAEELEKKSGQRLDPAEEICYEAHPLDELKAMIFSGELEDAKTAAGIMAYAALLAGRPASGEK